jgi:ubiquinone biosynthesis protein
MIEEDFGKTVEELFLEFDTEPLAAASIGQVHKALLFDGTQVVVKVQRPNIIDQVRSDLEIVRILVRMAGGTSFGRKYGVVDIFEEFARSLMLEMDYRNEAVNGDRLRRLMKNEPQVRVPFMYWDYISRRVLTMEYIDGVKVNDLKALDEAGVDRQKLADVFVKSMLTQLMLDGFYHADPHPGNLLVDVHKQEMIYIDLGMTGRLLSDQQQILQDMILSILRKDSLDVTRLVMTIGIPFQKVDERSLTRSIDYIINRYLESSLDKIDFSAVLSQILIAIFRHNIRLPSELSLALKTLVQGEEVARTLDPEISVHSVALGMSKKIMFDTFTPQYLLDSVRDVSRELIRLKDVLPRAMESILKQLEEGKLTVAVDIPMFKWIVNTFMIIANRLVAGLVIVGMLIGSSLLMNSASVKLGPYLQILGIAGFSVAMIMGGFLVWSVIREIGRFERRKKEDF